MSGGGAPDARVIPLMRHVYLWSRHRLLTAETGIIAYKHRPKDWAESDFYHRYAPKCLLHMGVDP